MWSILLKVSSHSDAVRRIWDELSDTWYKPVRDEEHIQRIVQRPDSAFHHRVFEALTALRPDLRGLNVCVLASGDNHAVFALHLLGATVTSVDISPRQIENARQVAEKRGWKISFVCSDITRLDGFDDCSYDLVYTSNDVHVWIDDLPAIYSNVFRILRQGGDHLMFEVHPFTRPFASGEENQRDRGRLTVVEPYSKVGAGGEPHEYGWRLQDFLNAIAGSGLHICRVEEFEAELGTRWGLDDWNAERNASQDDIMWRYDWRQNPLAAIPQWLLVHSRRM
jgi:SAM-dependent methyltransferase